MADGGIMMQDYPQVFVVDRQAPCAPVPTLVYPKRAGWHQRLLFALVVLALLGVFIEACCIYNLHKGHEDSSSTAKQVNKGSETNDISPVTKKSERKPAALLKGSISPEGPQDRRTDNGVLLWTDMGEAFLNGMDYKNGMLTVRQEGYYFLYSKVSIKEFQCKAIKHKMTKKTERYSKPIDLMESFRYRCPKTQRAEKSEEKSQTDVTNSYLGGAFYLSANDSIYVTLEKVEHIRPGNTENFFGAFML